MKSLEFDSYQISIRKMKDIKQIYDDCVCFVDYFVLLLLFVSSCLCLFVCLFAFFLVPAFFLFEALESRRLILFGEMNRNASNVRDLTGTLSKIQGRKWHKFIEWRLFQLEIFENEHFCLILT